MKKLVIIIVLTIAVVFGYIQLTKPKDNIVGGGGSPFTYIAATQATSSIGTYFWSTILAADSAREYATVCNNSIVANDAVYLSFGTASTTVVNSPPKPYGYRLGSGDCYTMNSDNLFYGNVYGVASTATTTILTATGTHY